MENRWFKGCGTALFTPFSQDGGIDYEAFGACVDRQVEAGIDFLVPLGTTGETPCLSDAEKVEVLRVARAHAAGRPVMVGVGTNSVGGTLANLRLLEEADAFLVVVPYYNKPPQRGIYGYFKAVASETDKPVILYNVPGRTGSNIEAATTLALAADVPNIVAIKEASGNFAQCEAILQGGFSLLSGNDGDTQDLMIAGADGVISVASNVCPREMARFVHLMQDGDFPAAAELGKRLQPLFEALFVEPNPIPGKAAMARLGLMENKLRLPLVPATADTEILLDDVLHQLARP